MPRVMSHAGTISISSDEGPFSMLSDEEFRNPVNYDEAVNGWLGGVNNMKTEVWWADHNQKRKKE